MFAAGTNDNMNEPPGERDESGQFVFQRDAQMKQPHKPKGYSTVSPYIVADGARAVIDFLVEVFGGTVPRRFYNPDGSVTHAEIKIEDTVIMMGDSGGEFPAFPVWLHV